jgi:hypothetical protein
MLREIIARFGLSFNTAPLVAGQAAIGGAVSSLRTLGALLVGGVVVTGIRNFIREIITMGDDLGKTSKQLGISITQLQRLQFAADRSGVDTKAFRTSVIRLQRSMVDLEDKSSTAVRAFDRLGLSLKDLQNDDGGLKDAEQVIPLLADRFNGLESQTERVAVAQQLLGRAGARMLPFFDEGAEGIQKLFRRFDQLAPAIGGDFTKAAEDAQDAITDLDLATTGFRVLLATQVLPTITNVVFKIAEGFGAFQRFAAGTNLVKAALVLLGSAAVVAAAKLIIPFLPAIGIALLAALAIGFIVLALDDLITFLEGGDSVIGEFFSELITFIVDSADRGEAWAQTLVAAFNLVKDVGTFLGESIFELEKAFKRIFPIIAKVVETNMIAIGAAIDAVISTFTNAMSTIRGGIRSIAGTLGIDVSSILPEQTGRATAEAGSRLAGGGGNTVTQTNQVGVTVNNSTGDPQAVGEAVGVAVRRELDRNMRNARSALLQAPA